MSYFVFCQQLAMGMKNVAFFMREFCDFSRYP